jgi:hypothetical protein
LVSDLCVLLAFEAHGLSAGEGVNGHFQLGWLVV